jgi:CRP-like cAMP-binding protein
MQDKTKSYKIVGGKFVERTPEQVALLEQRKAAQVAREPVQQRAPRTEGHFAKITLEQMARMHGLKSAACWFLFAALSYENFRQRGRPFVLSIEKVITVTGLSRANLSRALSRLEACGVIAVARNPPRPPQITVLEGSPYPPPSRSTSSALIK